MLSSPPSLREIPRQQAATELLRRRQARQSLLAFAQYTKSDYTANWHHEVLCRYLDRFAAGELKRLMVFMPPRHGKSELVSRRLPAYLLGRNPDLSVIACSYSAGLSSRLNRDVQRVIDSPPYRRLFPETELFGENVRTVAQGAYLRNSDIFEVVGHAGAYISAGIGGGITGMGCDVAIIDDPIKNREEADSPTFREANWEWYTSTLRTRLEPDAGILLTLTRWHQDDLAGRLLSQMYSDPSADQWTTLRFPALAETPEEAQGALPPPAEDKRRPGEALWPAKYRREQLAQVMSTAGPYEANALYQQRPGARAGNRIKREWFEIVEAAPKSSRRLRYWDKAGTAGGGAYTASVLMALDAKGTYYVEDVVRGQWSSAQRENVIRQTAEADRSRGPGKVWLEQEPGSGGKESAEATVKNLAGFDVHAEQPTGNKDTRLGPFEAQAEVGNVKLVRGPWNAAYLDELAAIPSGKYRDQADATSGAFNKLTLEADAEVKVRWI